MKQTTKFRSSLTMVLALMMLFAAFIGIPHNNYTAYALDEEYPEGNIEELSYSVNSNGYSFGEVATNANVPFVTLGLTGSKANPINTTFFYKAQANESTTAPGETWIMIGDEDKTDLQTTLYIGDLMGTTGLYDKFFFFKAVIDKTQDVGGDSQVVRYQWTDAASYHVIVRITNDDNSFQINNVTAEYKLNGGYNLYDTSNPTWVSTDIRFSVRGNDAKVNHTNFYYTLDGSQYLPAKNKLDISGNFYGEIIIDSQTLEKFGLKSYQGNVQFKSAPKGTEAYFDYNGNHNIKIDVAIPTFEISAQKGNGEVYSAGNWSNMDVHYTIIATNCASGIKMFYNQGGSDWVQLLEQAEGRYQVTITATTPNLKFKAESNAGKFSDISVNYATYIDKVAPKLSLSAVDGKGSKIKSLSDVPTIGYRLGYASNRIIFTLLNADNGVQINNSAPLKYQYRKKGDTEFSNLSVINSNFVLELVAPIKYATYEFRILSATGAVSAQSFDFSVIAGEFAFSMDELQDTANSDGWIKDEVPVYLNLPNFLDIEGEYKFFATIKGEVNTSEIAATKTEVINGIAKYRVYISQSIRNKIISFHAVNLAEDKSKTIDTKALNIDLQDPNATVTKKLYGSEVILQVGDWANGRVIITLDTNATVNISGIKCYEIAGPNLRGDEVINQNNRFVVEVITSNTYRFELVSGAGRSTFIDVVVNIDLNDISMELKPMTYDGEEILDFLGNTKISKDIIFNFDTNQNGHFNYYYIVYTGAYPTTDFPNGYNLGSGDSFYYSIPAGESIIKFAFVVESKALDADGKKHFSEVRTFILNYDATPFTINLYTDYKSGEWTNNAITFTFSIEDPVTISKYQYMIETSNEWIDCKVESNMFTFGGVQQKYKGKEVGLSYNGKIKFRALNQGGHPSNIVGENYVIMVDRSTPDSSYAIRQDRGEMASNINNSISVYSADDIAMRPTSDAVDKVFGQKAPIRYYYKDASISINKPAKNEMSELTSETVVNGGSYWILAENSLSISSDAILYQFIKEDTNSPLSATVEGGIINSSGTLEFNWADSASVIIKASSQSYVYYWYRFGITGEWQKHQLVAGMPGTPEVITFDADMNTTVFFRVTNLAGSLIEAGRAIIKIDTLAPTFGVKTTLGNQIIEEAQRNAWYDKAININIDQTSENPGGVTYKYRVNDSNTYEKLPGNGRFFSTDDLVGYAKNGTVTLHIQATANANGQTQVTSMTLNVDKTSPEFKLTGQAGFNDNSTGQTITSGQWTRGDYVTIYKGVKDGFVAYSKITYKYHMGDIHSMLEWNSDMGSIKITSLMTITVIATNQAGTTYIQTFQVNIDNVAPKIDAGKIVNKILEGNTIDYENPYRYYLDQKITYIEAHVKVAKFNGFPLSNGHILSSQNIDNSNGGYIHIVVEDFAGNKAELVFFMSPFELTINNITLSEGDKQLLRSFEADFNNAKETLTSSRQAYFANVIGRLNDRLGTLQKEVDDYRYYLNIIQGKASFELKSDFGEMKKYIDHFETEDWTVRYPDWQQTEILKGEYAAYYAKLKTAFESLNALMSEVQKIEYNATLLPAINIVKTTDYEAIRRVADAYESLLTDQKAVFNENLYNKIMQVRRQCEILLLQDPTTGISIAGDDLFPGVKIEVLTYTRTSDLFTSAQKTLMRMVSEDKVRAILSINKLALQGNGAQAQTGRVFISLPVPEDYQNYVEFAVYKLMSDGSIFLINDTSIAADGKSVNFYANELETYILAVKANITTKLPGDKVYGVMGGIEITYTMLQYISVAVIGIFVLMAILLIIAGQKYRYVLKGYNRKHKKSLYAKGIENIPKGNKAPYTNPIAPDERVKTKRKITKL